jgi:hypothetical protein
VIQELLQFDWDFRGVEDWELVASCHYEFARESKTFVNFYDHQIPFNQYLGLSYRAKTGGKLLVFPNPFQWPWIGTIGIEMEKSPLKFAETPWQSLRTEYREMVANGYEPTRYITHKGFSRADSVWMAPDIISRGDSRVGLDPEKGIERIAVEIDWAAFDDLQLVASFKEWVTAKRPDERPANRPDGIGEKSQKGKGKFRDWRAKLKRLAVARLLSRCTLKQLPARYPEAWDWLQKSGEWRTPFKTVANLYEQGQESDIYHMGKQAAEDFRELFPFLPPEEKPRFETLGRK